MKEEKKKTSFLYNLYQKYKKGDPNIFGDQAAREPVPDEPAPEISPPNTISASSEDAAGTPTETLAEAPAENASEPPVTLDPFLDVPIGKRYLKPLYELYLIMLQSEGQDQPMGVLPFETWMLSPISSLSIYNDYKDEISGFLRKLCLEIEKQLPLLAYKEPERGRNIRGPKDAPPEEIEEVDPDPYDSAVHYIISHDNMHAFVFVTPPAFGGKEMDSDGVARTLAENGIVFGLNQALIGEISAEKHYLQVYMVAEGQYPVNGKDGSIVDQYGYRSKIEIHQDNRGQADFKNLHSVQKISKDQVICDIIPPGNGTPGKNVTGSDLPCKDGKYPSIPNGKNTVISEDGLHLLSAVDGQILYKNSHYHVEPILVIQTNIDYGVGNVEFPGNIVVYGDVCNGFSVKAGGDVSVYGMVESASITAGGDVTLKKGMNGNFSGMIDAGGSVSASFLENCTVYAGGALHSNSIVSCDIFCEDTVYLQSNPGVIIGGTITAFRSVEARIIGSKSRRETTIILGEMPRLLEKKNKLQADITEAENVLDKLDKNINYLSKMQHSLPPEKLEILSQLNQQRDLYGEQKTENQKTLTELSSTAADYKECRVQCNMIFAPTKIVIGPESYTFTTLTSKCNVFLSEKGIEVGASS